MPMEHVQAMMDRLEMVQLTMTTKLVVLVQLIVVQVVLPSAIGVPHIHGLIPAHVLILVMILKLYVYDLEVVLLLMEK